MVQSFILGFYGKEAETQRDPSIYSQGPKYLNYIKEVIENGEVVVNVDSGDIWENNPTLYKKMVQYPSEVLTIFDKSLLKLSKKRFAEFAADPDANLIVSIMPTDFSRYKSKVVYVDLKVCAC